MPKQRQTCTRCSMRRQKCDRKSPCSRCIQNKEPHLCTTEWPNGYNPAIHRKYPKKPSPTSSQHSISLSSDPLASLDGNPRSQTLTQSWPIISTPGQGLPTHFRSSGQAGPHNARDRSFSTTSSTEDARGGSQEPNTSSTNVDFITYGRSDYADISMGTLLAEKDAYARTKALMEQDLNQGRNITCLDDTATKGFATVFSPAARSVEVYHIQSLLPTKAQVLTMVDYHYHCMSYWCGGIYHAPSFRRTLLEAYGQSEELDLRTLDWRWSALLFSLLSGSMIGSPESVSSSWGFSDTEKTRLARQWGNALMTCLHLGDYASKHHIYSVQAILNMHTSEHLVGSTKEWTAYQAAGTVIARGLGLHKLGPHPEDGRPHELNPEQKEALINREIGRRVWSAITSQDWLCSTSQGMYTLQKRHYSSLQPSHFDEETMTPVPGDTTPTFTGIGNYLNDIAYVLIRYLDDMMDAPDLASKYNVVLRYDALMRALTTEKMPKFLLPRTPLDPSWPRWASWARRSYQASCAHKVIMVHQSFLGRSFKDPRYTYSRWACVTNSKIIIEVLNERHPEEPQWWVEQAFVVTAGLCLALDSFHRPEKDIEAREHRLYVDRAIKILQGWPTSSVAAHGIRLLTSLLQEHGKKIEDMRIDAQAQTNPPFPNNIAPQALANAASEAEPPEISPQDSGIGSDQWGNPNFDVDMLGFEGLMDTLPMEAGLDNNVFFESMLSLANNQFI